MREERSNKRNSAEHVPSCSTWPPPWLSKPSPPAEIKRAAAERAPADPLADTRLFAEATASDPDESTADPGEEVQATADLLSEPCRPTPPPGARLYFGDQRGRPCEADKADHWTWEGGPMWFKTAAYPIPGVPERKA
jgi:hypothetical protein